jgi:hypothetical protein
MLHREKKAYERCKIDAVLDEGGRDVGAKEDDGKKTWISSSPCGS